MEMLVVSLFIIIRVLAMGPLFRKQMLAPIALLVTVRSILYLL